MHHKELSWVDSWESYYAEYENINVVDSRFFKSEFNDEEKREFFTGSTLSISDHDRKSGKRGETNGLYTSLYIYMYSSISLYIHYTKESNILIFITIFRGI